MFIPNEACLGAAFENDPDLLEYAIGKKVLISSPVNLLALLRAVEGYNRALGSLDKRLIPAVRRFQEMDLSATQFDAPRKIEVQPTFPLASESETLNDDD